MPKRTVAAASLGLILACAAYAQVARAPSEAVRQRLAVLDFPLDQAYVGPVTVRDLENGIRERIQRQLTHRRFTVLDRSDKGADLVLSGTVERFAVQAITITIRISGERLERLAGTTLMHVRLLDVAAGEVTWADSFEVEMLSPERSAQRMADSLLDELAGQVVDALMERIEPIAVPEVTAPGPVVAGDGDGDGIPDYLNRRANPADSNRDGLPDYLNRYFLQRRPMQSRLRRTGAR